jgi:hypothetical protein
VTTNAHEWERCCAADGQRPGADLLDPPPALAPIDEGHSSFCVARTAIQSVLGVRVVDTAREREEATHFSRGQSEPRAVGEHARISGWSLRVALDDNTSDRR